MSSILKALKKLEQEKAVRKPDSFRIDAEILRGGTPRSFFSTGASLAAIALFLCGVGATYVFMKRHEVPAAVQPAQAPAKQASSVPPAAVGLPLGSAGQGAPDPLPRPTMPGKSGPEPSGPSPRTMPSPLPPQPEKLTGGTPRAVQPESKPMPPSAAPPAVVITPGPPVLKVLGIAFQDGSTNSVAVVNGVAVTKGSVIEGVRVEEIQKDRVKFSRGGETFEIILDKSN